MKLSFIVAAYNEENYIAKCLEAILSQKDLPEYEIIVVDNVSTDRTAEVVKERFPQVKIVQELRKGVTRARNRGVKEARGELLVFFDADCVAPRDWTSKMLAIFKKRPEAVLVSGPYHHEGLSFHYRVGEFLLYKVGFFLVHTFVGRILLRGAYPFMEGNCAIKREIFDKVGGYNENLTFYGDGADLSMRLIKEGKLVFSQKLQVQSSSRRLKGEHPVRSFFLYIVNVVWVVWLGKPFSKSYRDIR